MTFAFARLRAGLCGESARVSHVLHLPETDGTPSTLISLCGRRFPPGMLEMVPEWAGAPCVACTVLLPISAAPPAPAEPAAPPEVERCEPCGSPARAAAFSGEQLCHLLPEHAQRHRCDGRTVALSACGHLVYDWRDGSCPGPPSEWRVCGDCAALARPGPMVVRGGDGTMGRPA